MKVIIESNYKLRGQNMSSYYSFPVFSEQIEQTLIRQLEFHERCGHAYTLELKIIKE